MTIKNIVFDFGGVLFDWDPRYFYLDVFNGDKEKTEYFIENICTGTWNAQMDRGRSFAECIAELQAQFPQYKYEIGLYRQGWDTMLKGEIAEGVKLFKKIRDSRAFPLYGLTNWSAETIGSAISRFDILSDLKGIVVSGQECRIKPEPEIYQALLKRYDLIPSECLFIDDKLENIEGARLQGMQGVQCTGDYEALTAQIEKLTGVKL